MPQSNNARPKRLLRIGANVVCTTGRVEGVDPFTRLIVTRVHADGTVDLKIDQDLRRWIRIPARDLLKVH